MSPGTERHIHFTATTLTTIKARRIISRLCILVLIDAVVRWLNYCRCAHQFPSSVCVPWRGWMKTLSSSRTWCSSSPRTTTGSCTSSTSSARCPIQFDFVCLEEDRPKFELTICFQWCGTLWRRWCGNEWNTYRKSCFCPTRMWTSLISGCRPSGKSASTTSACCPISTQEPIGVESGPAVCRLTGPVIMFRQFSFCCCD